MRTLLFMFLLALSTPLLAPVNAWAVEPSEMLKNPVLEARARDIGLQLRCVVCQNESIEVSNAELAGDMRVLVRQRVQAGKSNADVINYMVSRYGDYVLLDPPFKASTLVLWIGPGVIAVLGIFAVVFFFRRRGAGGGRPSAEEGEAAVLSGDERNRLAKILKDHNV